MGQGEPVGNKILPRIKFYKCLWLNAVRIASHSLRGGVRKLEALKIETSRRTPCTQTFPNWNFYWSASPSFRDFF